MKQLQIIGNIGFDAIVKEVNGNKFVQFTVAVNESFKDKDGNKVEKTHWINCTSKSLTLSQYLKKGTRVFAQGNMNINVYKAKDGSYSAGINLNCSSVQFLGGGKKEETATPAQSTGDPFSDLRTPPEEDDLPF